VPQTLHRAKGAPNYVDEVLEEFLRSRSHAITVVSHLGVNSLNNFEDSGEILDLNDGSRLLSAVEYSLRWLEVNSDAINRLNVYPVPDGDTGTNMVLTLQAAVREAGECGSKDVNGVSAALGRGGLLGARGNSGVILSQILRGFSEGLANSCELGVVEFASALVRAAEVAYQAVTNPVEGTILTVARDAGLSATLALSRVNSIKDLLAVVVDASRESVANTPNQLPILAEAGVVDAGGKGLQVIFEGMLRFVRGEPLPELVDVGTSASVFAAFAEAHKDDSHGYCTEFIVRGSGLDTDVLRRELESLGDSLLVVGDSELVRVHVHTERPGDVITAALVHGQIDQLKAENMDVQQAQNFGQVLNKEADMPRANGVVAVADGDGLEHIFRSLGATLVRGGQTMNPSAGDLLAAIEGSPGSVAFILPNNANILMAAQQAAEQSEKVVHVVPTRSVPQGIAAAMRFNPTEVPGLNVQAMTRAAQETTTLEVTRAVRDVVVGGTPVVEGQYIGLIDERLVESDAEINTVVRRMLERVVDDDVEVVTVYGGATISDEQLEALASGIGGQYLNLDVESFSGGQDHYEYIISVE
jgi:DAK2 domain fusion protein YloV